MAELLRHAFKEWAVICLALATGRQSLILRKSGIAEPGGDGEFQLEAKRFWLFPTFVHQQETGIREEALPMLEEVRVAHPPADRIRLEAWAEVTSVYEVRARLPAHIIAHLHFWSEDTVEKRFAYRHPGLNVLTVRVWRAPRPIEIPNLAEYRGCKSWVPLDPGIDATDSTPVLSDRDYRDVVTQLDTLLRPTAFA